MVLDTYFLVKVELLKYSLSRKISLLKFSKMPMKVRTEVIKKEAFLKVKTKKSKEKASQEDEDGTPAYHGEY